MNVYQFVFDNPVTFTDPEGLAGGRGGGPGPGAGNRPNTGFRRGPGGPWVIEDALVAEMFDQVNAVERDLLAARAEVAGATKCYQELIRSSKSLVQSATCILYAARTIDGILQGLTWESSASPLAGVAAKQLGKRLFWTSLHELGGELIIVGRSLTVDNATVVSIGASVAVWLLNFYGIQPQLPSANALLLDAVDELNALQEL
jgi:hypothetical protein